MGGAFPKFPQRKAREYSKDVIVISVSRYSSIKSRTYYSFNAGVGEEVIRALIDKLKSDCIYRTS